MTSSTPLPNLPDVGARIRHVRERMGLSRAELGEALAAAGVSRASAMTIRRTERGARSPTVEEVVAVARLAGVSSVWLVSGSSSPRASASAAEEERIMAQLRAELVRSEGDATSAIERVEAHLRDERVTGALGEGGWSFWRGLRRGAALSVREHDSTA